jgi:VWFA-related protein
MSDRTIPAFQPPPEFQRVRRGLRPGPDPERFPIMVRLLLEALCRSSPNRGMAAFQRAAAGRQGSVADKGFRGKLMGSVPSARGRSLLPFRHISLLFSFLAALLLSAALPASGGTGGLKVRIERVTIDTTVTLGGKRADFPSPVMSIITVKDRSNRWIHGLADTTRWLSNSDVNQLGVPVSQAWPALLEYHAGDSLKPKNPDLKATTPGFKVREMRLDMGLSVALVMDYSGSMIGRFDSVKTAARAFVRQMQSKDRVAVWKFAKKSFLMQDFTSDTTKLLQAIDTDTSDWAGTYFYDALWTALKATESQPERRVVIAYTDGRDHNMGHTIDQVLDLARADSIPIYTIGLSNNNPAGGGPQIHYLQQIAEVTGGMSYFAPSIDSLGPIYREIYGHISGYYVLAHTSPDPFFNGKKRALDLTFRYDQVMGSTTTVYTGRDTAQYAVPFIPPNEAAFLAVTRPPAPAAGQLPIAVAGDTVGYRITIRNTGRGPAAGTKIGLALHDSLTYVSASPPPDSVRGRTAFWSAYYVGRRDSLRIDCKAVLPPIMPAGDTRLTSTVTVSCLDDSIPSDNAASADIVAAARPDFTIRLRPVAGVITPGYAVPVEAVVANRGNAARTGAFTVSLTQVAPSRGSSWTETVPSLATGDSAVVVFRPSFAAAGAYVVAAAADPLHAVPELDETNNADSAAVSVGVTSLRARIGDFAASGSVRGRIAWFPGRVIAAVTMMDQNRHPVSGLADTTSWLDLSGVDNLGHSVGSVWTALSEVHEENPAYPPEPDVRPGLSVTQIRGASVSMAVVLDRSAAGPDVDAELSAFFDRFGGTDRAAVIGFNAAVQTLQPLTSDVAALKASLSAPAAGSSRRLVDAVAAGIEAVSGAAGRNGVIVVTSGPDAGSGRTAGAVCRLASESGVPVTVIACGPHAADPKIDSLTARTGGWTLGALSGPAPIPFADALQSAEESLRNYYGLAFASSDTTQDLTWRRVGLSVSAYGLAASDTGLYRVPQGAANVAVLARTRGTSFTASAGDTTWFARTGDRVRVSVSLLNIGNQDLSGVRLTDFLPHTFVPDSVPFAHAAAGDSLSWICDDLPIRAVRSWAYTVVADTLVAPGDTVLTHTVRALCGPDTSQHDNAVSNSVTYVPFRPPDFEVAMDARGDSLASSDGGPVWYAHAGGPVTVTVTVANRGELACPAVSMTAVLPHELRLASFTGSPFSQRGDSLFWFIDELASRGGSRAVTIACRVDSFLPPWEVTLAHRAWGVSDGQPASMTANDAAADTVIVAALIPPGPGVGVSPAVVDRGDTVSVRVLTPVTVASWDLRVLYENGETLSNYGDAFIASHPDLEKNAWIRVEPAFSDTRMRTARTRERVGVIFRTVDLWDVARADTAWFTIQPPDFRVDVQGTGDSLAVAGGDTVRYAHAGGTVTWTVTAGNPGELPCSAIFMTDVVPHQLSLTSFTGAAFSQRGDSLFWSIDELAGRGGSRAVTFTCAVDSFLPPWEVPLINRAWGRSDAEIAAGAADDADADTVVVAALIPPDPEAAVSPATVEPGDTVAVRVKTPVTVASWDLEVFFETGETLTDYGDAFIASHPDLETGAWIRVEPAFADTRMRTRDDRERVGVVFRTVDLWNVTRADTAFFEIRSSDAFFLGGNVFHPSSGDRMEFRFKLSSNRRADVTVYDASGAFVRRVASGAFPAGWSSAFWDGTDDSGRRAGSGVYVAVAGSGELQKAQKFILVR